MARTNDSEQSAPDLTKQCFVRQPGLWLDEPFTTQEVKDVRTLHDIKEIETDIDKLIDSIAPYMNSLVHLTYLMIHKRFGIEAVENGVKFKGKDLYFDIIQYAMDYVLDTSRAENSFKQFMNEAREKYAIQLKKHIAEED